MCGRVCAYVCVQSPLVCSRQSKWPTICSITRRGGGGATFCMSWIVHSEFTCTRSSCPSQMPPLLQCLLDHLSPHWFFFPFHIGSAYNLYQGLTPSWNYGWQGPIVLDVHDQPLDPRKSCLLTSPFCIHQTCRHIKSSESTCWSLALEI